MLPITDKKLISTYNAWGSSTSGFHQDFEIEQSDINTTKDHYLGYNHNDYRFVQSDLGKTIKVQTDNSNWTCWTFN